MHTPGYTNKHCTHTHAHIHTHSHPRFRSPNLHFVTLVQPFSRFLSLSFFLLFILYSNPLIVHNACNVLLNSKLMHPLIWSSILYIFIHNTHAQRFIALLSQKDSFITLSIHPQHACILFYLHFRYHINNDNHQALRTIEPAALSP